MLGWLKENADGRAIISLMNQYTPVPFSEDAGQLESRKKSLSAIENRLVTPQEDSDLQDLIEAFDFEMLELLKPYVTIWLPDLKTLNSQLAGKLFAAPEYPEAAVKAISWMIQNNPIKIESAKASRDYTDANGEKIIKGEEREKMTQGVIIRHLFMPGKFSETADVLGWQSRDQRLSVT